MHVDGMILCAMQDFDYYFTSNFNVDFKQNFHVYLTGHRL
jgi:hypothetical protein